MSLSSVSSSHFLGLRDARPSPSSGRPCGIRVPATTTVTSSLYDVLGVSRGASGQEIKDAYRRLARKCHPDVVATGGRGDSADEFMLVHAAYATLSDPRKRADYDRGLTAPARSRLYRRTWETDQCW